MKALRIFTILILGGVFLCTTQTVSAHKQEDPLVVKYHKRMMKRYKKRVTKQDVDIGMHKKMIEEYQRHQFISKKSNAYSKDLEELKKHCEAIIKQSEDLKKEYELFASWHEMKMNHLKGKK
jgi:hypothetical protein